MKNLSTYHKIYRKKTENIPELTGVTNFLQLIPRQHPSQISSPVISDYSLSGVPTQTIQPIKILQLIMKRFDDAKI